MAHNLVSSSLVLTSSLAIGEKVKLAGALLSCLEFFSRGEKGRPTLHGSLWMKE